MAHGADIKERASTLKLTLAQEKQDSVSLVQARTESEAMRTKMRVEVEALTSAHTRRRDGLMEELAQARRENLR